MFQPIKISVASGCGAITSLTRTLLASVPLVYTTFLVWMISSVDPSAVSWNVT